MSKYKRMLPEEFIEIMNGLGLDRFQQAKCLAVWRDGNRKEAVDDAKEYARKHARSIAAAREAALTICGLKI